MQDNPLRFPANSIAEAFDRYRKTDEWLVAKKIRTREEWERSWSRIEPVFGDLSPTSNEITLETLSIFRRNIKETVSEREAWRTIKIWRALWNVCVALGYCYGKSDPSLGIKNPQPLPRSSSWREGEVVRLVKEAWRSKYYGLAVTIAFAWDTQFSPVDLRSLTVSGICGHGQNRYLPVDRAKSGRAAIGTLGSRSLALLDEYLEKHPCDVGAFLRNRSGAPYSRYTLPDDFATIRDKVFPKDKRTLADMRRSGAIELQAGGAAPTTTAAKMANSISSANAIHKTYQPVDLETVRQADNARKIGRQRMRETNKK